MASGAAPCIALAWAESITYRYIGFLQPCTDRARGQLGTWAALAPCRPLLMKLRSAPMFIRVSPSTPGIRLQTKDWRTTYAGGRRLHQTVVMEAGQATAVTIHRPTPAGRPRAPRLDADFALAG